MFRPSALVNQEFRKFVLFDQLLMVQMDAGAEEMRTKTKGVKSVYIILTQWPAIWILGSCTSAEGDLYITLLPSAHEGQQHRHCASGKDGDGAAWCFSVREGFGLGLKVPPVFFPGLEGPMFWLKSWGHVSGSMWDIILLTCTDWVRAVLVFQSGFLCHPLKSSWGCTVNYSTSKMLQNSALETWRYFMNTVTRMPRILLDYYGLSTLQLMVFFKKSVIM